MGKLSPPVGMGAVRPALSALDTLWAVPSPLSWGGFVSYTFKGRTDSIVSRSFADLKSDQGEMHVKLHPWVSSVPCPEILQGHSG